MTLLEAICTWSLRVNWPGWSGGVVGRTSFKEVWPAQRCRSETPKTTAPTLARTIDFKCRFMAKILRYCWVAQSSKSVLGGAVRSRL